MGRNGWFGIRAPEAPWSSEAQQSRGSSLASASWAATKNVPLLGMQRGQSHPTRHQGSSCSRAGQAGKSLLQLLLVSTARPRVAQHFPGHGVHDKHHPQPLASLRSPKHFTTLTLGSGEQPPPYSHTGSNKGRQVKGFAQGKSQRARNGAADALPPKVRPHVLANSSRFPTSPSLVNDCAAKGGRVQRNMACLCPRKTVLTVKSK